ncbi:MAG TPA: hypothetical protein VFO69_08460 [Allosphingosinicella sp.]|nr:hypothetical protein [Allosphingosinicella sp.]
MDSGISLRSVTADESHGFKPRRSPRVVIEGETELSPHKLYKIEVTVRNVSALGFMAECSEPVRIGSYVSLDIPGIGPVNAQVRWQIGVRMGGMFVDPISLARCDWTATEAD